MKFGLLQHRKWIKLSRLVRKIDEGGCPEGAALGMLHFLWSAAYESGPMIGSAEDVELTARWEGEDGEAVNALLHSGFLDYDEDTDRYSVHDLYDHAPEYVLKKRYREIAKSWGWGIKRYTDVREMHREGLVELASPPGCPPVADSGGQRPLTRAPAHACAPAPTPALRGEERRGVERSKSPPTPPNEWRPRDDPGSQDPTSRGRTPGPPLEIPPELVSASPEFEGLWRRRMAAANGDRRQVGPKLEAAQLGDCVAWVGEHGVEAVMRSVDTARRGGWKNIPEPAKNGHGHAAARDGTERAIVPGSPEARRLIRSRVEPHCDMSEAAVAARLDEARRNVAAMDEADRRKAEAKRAAEGGGE